MKNKFDIIKNIINIEGKNILLISSNLYKEYDNKYVILFKIITKYTNNELDIFFNTYKNDYLNIQIVDYLDIQIFDYKQEDVCYIIKLEVDIRNDMMYKLLEEIHKTREYIDNKNIHFYLNNMFGFKI